LSDISRLNSRVAQAFYGRFSALWPAQEAAICPILSRENVVISAGTGSGKTEAILAPLVDLFWEDAMSSCSTAILYIAPTKALLNDVLRRIERPLSDLGLRAGVRHGDRNDLKRVEVPHVLLTTPESLDVLLFGKNPALRDVRALILDEAHLLYNTQRGLQFSILVQRLRVQLSPRPLQWAALSATMSRLDDVRDFLFGEGEAAQFLSFPAAKPIDAQIRRITRDAELVELVGLLETGRPVKLLMFADSRRTCERLAGILKQNGTAGPTVFAHYSSLSPEVRLETEARFAEERKAICIATSTLELGIDIGDIDAVMLWGPPPSVESFLQRIGRSNRRTQKTCVVCIIPDDSRAPLADSLRFLAVLEMARAGEIPRRGGHELYGAIAQQCLSVVAAEEARFIRIADLTSLSQHRSYVLPGRVEEILANLEEGGFLKRHGFKNRYGAAEALYELVDYRLIYGNFPLRSQVTEVQWGEKVLGEVPTANVLRVKVGCNVRFAGKLWRVQRICREAIRVEPARGEADVVDFSYGGSGRSCDPVILDKIREMLYSDGDWATSMSTGPYEDLTEFRKALKEQSTRDCLPFARTQETCRYLTFGGRLVNKAIALFSNQPSYTAGDLCLETALEVDWASLPTKAEDYEPLFPALFEATSDQSLFQQALPASLQLVEFLQDWLKDPAIPNILARLAASRPVAIEGRLVEALRE